MGDSLDIDAWQAAICQSQLESPPLGALAHWHGLRPDDDQRIHAWREATRLATVFRKIVATWVL
jgi:hypothetical protein